MDEDMEFDSGPGPATQAFPSEQQIYQGQAINGGQEGRKML